MEAKRNAPIDADALDEAAEWLMCLSASDVTDAERAAWAIWRNSSPERDHAWRRAELLMGKLGGLPPTLALSTLDRPVDPGRRAVITRLAALLALAPASWAGWKFTEEQGWMADYASAVGECRDLKLADGTRVFLNTDSAIDVRFESDQRLILLRRGEILIETAPDNRVPSRPLRVGTTEGRMEALGTRFTVRENAGRTYLAVLEGAVRVEPRYGTNVQPLVVQAGQKTNFDTHSTLNVSSVDKTITAWTQGMLLVDNMRLADFVGELARYRRGFVRFESAIANIRISGTFPINDTELALNMLVSTYPVAATVRMNGYWILLSSR
ncbi:fec operon regulator FecR [compost metagenome]